MSKNDMSYDLLGHIKQLQDRVAIHEASPIESWQHQGMSTRQAKSNKDRYIKALKRSICERIELAESRGQLTSMAL